MDSMFIQTWFKHSGYIIDASVISLPSDRWVKSMTLYEEYKTYCSEIGASDTASKNKLADFLKNRGGQKKQTKRTIILNGQIIEERSTFYLNIYK